MSTQPNQIKDTVDFDGYPGVEVDGIVQIIEGYCPNGDPSNPRILVVLTNGAVLNLDRNEINLAAVAKWRKLKAKLGYSG